MAKATSRTGVALGGLLLTSICLLALSGHKDFEERQFRAHGFHLKAAIRHDNWCNVFCPSYFVVESLEGDQWREFAKLGSDDPFPLEEKYVRILDAEVAYAYFHSEMVITRDGGRTWEKVSPAERFGIPEPQWIKDVSLESYGSGSMLLFDVEKERIVITKDFWKSGTVTSVRQRQ